MVGLTKQFKELEYAYLKAGTPIFFTEFQDEFILANDYWMIVTIHSMNTVFGVLGSKTEKPPQFWCDDEVIRYITENRKAIRIKGADNVLTYEEFKQYKDLKL